MKVWLNVTEAAEYAGVSRDTIYTPCERRELRHARIGGRRACCANPTVRHYRPIWSSIVWSGRLGGRT
jgi:excisionase family DNA binding protein